MQPTPSSTQFRRRLTRISFGVSIVCGLIIGCTRQNELRRGARDARTNVNANTKSSAGATGLLREAARATRIARAYDEGIEAARRGDETAFIGACAGLRALQAMPESLALASGAAVSDAEKFVSRAIILDTSAQQASRTRDENIKSPTRNSESGESGYSVTNEAIARGDASFGENEVAEPSYDELRFLAARDYRRALQLAPRFDSPDPNKLNALAYFLAERGARERDFVKGEALARRAIAMLDEAIAQGAGRGYRIELWKSNRAMTRDTLAWALFRRGHFKEALREQQNAVQESEAASRSIKKSLPPNASLDESDPGRAELLFHLGEILRALGRTSEARTQFQTASKVDPTHAQSRDALRALNAVAPSTPTSTFASPSSPNPSSSGLPTPAVPSQTTARRKPDAR